MESRPGGGSHMLRLKDYQLALSAAVVDMTPSGGSDLTPWGLSARGIAMTGHVRRSWCMGRARRAAPLTLCALPPDLAEAILADWVAAGGSTGSFFEAEAIALIDFIVERIWDGTHAMSLACFERAVLRARATPWINVPHVQLRPGDVVVRALGADMVTLEAPIAALLAAIEGNAPWPELDGRTCRLLVAPGVEGLAREATEEEAAFWDATQAGVFADYDLETANEMVRCGALLSLAPI
jgi:hypothetical protein